ncbi:MAG: hypothetical protein H0V62_11495, partial [Gammaproteobacteria bacterium]|nr:hypothetical protein [Gammaproteobacteria bacterium]
MNSEARLQSETPGGVKKELDAVLDRARRALESYIDNPNETVWLTQLQESLRQVAGTLQTVDLYGAAMLAEEMRGGPTQLDRISGFLSELRGLSRQLCWWRTKVDGIRGLPVKT